MRTSLHLDNSVPLNTNCKEKIKIPALVRGQFFNKELGIRFDIDFTNLQDEYIYENEFAGHTIRMETKAFSYDLECRKCKEIHKYFFNEFENVD